MVFSLKPDFVVGYEEFKDLLFKFGQSDDKNVFYYEEDGKIICVILHNNCNYWLIIVRESIDLATLDDIFDKGIRVNGVLNLVLHNDLLRKFDEVKDATNTALSSGKGNELFRERN